jgi:hypothetical protein
MSHGHGDLPETCKFGHIVEAWEDGGNGELQEAIEKGEVESLSELRNFPEDGKASIAQLFEKWKHIKVSSGSQGTAFAAVFDAVDTLEDSMGYSIQKLNESLFVSPQSNMHQEFMNRKQQAEQNIKQTMQSYQQLMKQKHMLQHDIRKLRSRVEAINSKDETLLKGDFIELVDGAGGAPSQGGDQMSLKAYRDQSIFPTIVSDFNEMDSLDDLKTAEQKAEGHEDKDADDFEDGVLADLPDNEKAILNKKYKMYEQWKDLYGSEVSRKLDDLKGQMKNIERSIEETEEWLEPYVRDVNMINKMGEDQTHMGQLNIRGNSTMLRQLDYIFWKPMKKENGEIVIADGDDEATHYRIIYVKGIHANLASFEQPQSPADGPSAGQVIWMPGFVCRHVFEDIIRPAIDEFENEVDQMMDEYTGDYETDTGNKLKDARNEEELSVRELRSRIQNEVDEKVPIELSSDIRRIEDGLEEIDKLEEKYSSDYIEAIDKILDTDFVEEDESEGDSNMYTGFQRKYKTFFGRTDPFYLENPEDGVDDLANELRFEYYWGFKLGLGLYTMK